MAARASTWNTEHEVELLGPAERRRHRGRRNERAAHGSKRDIDATEVILSLAPETNGEVAVKAWEALSKATGRDHAHLAIPKEDEKIRFRDLVAQPRKIISSPTWSGIESEKVCYNAGYTNVHELIPWRTLTGRQQLYQDHLWMRAFRRGAMRLPAADRHQERQSGDRGQIRRPSACRAELHHAASEMGHPFNLYGQSADADAQSRRPGGLDLRE